MTDKLKMLHVNLMVSNVQNTLDYYESIGFSTVQKVPKELPEWAMVQKDQVSLMFQSTNSLTTEFPQLEGQLSGKPLTLWIQTENIDNYFEKIKGKVKIVKELGITAYNGASEFVIEDNNGFILHFSNMEL
ncbi:MAG: VOC family protein [Marinoscillum sp.]